MRSTPALISSYIIHVQARASSKTPHSNHSNQTMTYPFLLSTLQFWFRYNEKSPHHVARLHRFRHDSGKSLSQFSSFSFVQMPSSIDQLLLLRFAFRYRQRGFRFFFFRLGFSLFSHHVERLSVDGSLNVGKSGWLRGGGRDAVIRQHETSHMRATTVFAIEAVMG